MQLLACSGNLLDLSFGCFFKSSLFRLFRWLKREFWESQKKGITLKTGQSGQYKMAAMPDFVRFWPLSSVFRYLKRATIFYHFVPSILTSSPGDLAAGTDHFVEYLGNLNLRLAATAAHRLVPQAGALPVMPDFPVVATSAMLRYLHLEAASQYFQIAPEAPGIAHFRLAWSSSRTAAPKVSTHQGQVPMMGSP